MTQNKFPRRNQLNLSTPAEKAIYDAVILLSKAKDLVADYVDLQKMMNDPNTLSVNMETGYNL